MTASRDDTKTRPAPKKSAAKSAETKAAESKSTPKAERKPRSTTPRSKPRASTPAPPNAAAVERYLRDHPDFFADHLALLDVLRIPHPVRGAVSLLETQVRVLRDKNRYLGEQIDALCHNASANQTVVAQLHRLALTLVRQPSPSATIDTVRSFLVRELRAECVHVLLLDAAPDTATHRPDADWKELSPVLDAGTVLCGRHRRTRLDAAFGPDSDAIQSAILAPLRVPASAMDAATGSHPETPQTETQPETLGLLAIGSTDATRYQSDMGTFLLSHLAELLAAALSVERATTDQRASPPAAATR